MFIGVCVCVCMYVCECMCAHTDSTRAVIRTGFIESHMDGNKIPVVTLPDDMTCPDSCQMV